MPLTVFGCNATEQAMIWRAAQVAASKLTVGVCGLGGLEGLRQCMLAGLIGPLPLSVACSDCEGRPIHGVTIRGQGLITLCRRAFALGQLRLNSLLFHEMVHSCGGDELDAEGLEAHCSPEGGATPPSLGDYRQFMQRPLQYGFVPGNYLLWHPQTGSVFVRGADGVSPGMPLWAAFRGPHS